MSVKLIMTWDIHPGKEQEYFEFVVQTFMPHLQNLGLELNDAWVTVYGEYPQVMVSAQMESLAKAQKVVGSEDWLQLNDQLQEFVDNYTFKLVPLKGAFQF